MTLITMYDAWSAGGIPASASYVAGYVRGGDYDALVARFPHATHFSISTSSAVAANCLDVERGDASPDQALGWVLERQREGWYRPCVYSSIALYMPEVQASLAHLPRHSYRLWVAHWTPASKPTAVPAGYDGVQWLNTPSYDASLLLEDFFAPAAAKPPTLTSTEKHHLSAVHQDLVGIIAQKGQLTQAEFDQLRLAYERIGAIPGVK